MTVIELDKERKRRRRFSFILAAISLASAAGLYLGVVNFIDSGTSRGLIHEQQGKTKDQGTRIGKLERRQKSTDKKVRHLEGKKRARTHRAPSSPSAPQGGTSPPPSGSPAPSSPPSPAPSSPSPAPQPSPSPAPSPPQPTPRPPVPLPLPHVPFVPQVCLPVVGCVN